MGTGLEGAGIKQLVGAGLGAAGGALSDDPSQLSTFVDEFGNPNLERVRGTVSVDPGDILARGLQSNARLTDAVARLAGQPTQLGPASIIQQAPFAFGGALPASIGIGIRDPGFLQRPGIDLGLGMGGFASPVPNPGEPDPFEPPPEGPGDPGHPPPNDPEDPVGREPIDGGDDPFKPITKPIEDPPGAIPTRFSGSALPTAIPTQRGELSQFLDAVNLANLKRGRPIVRGGLR